MDPLTRLGVGLFWLVTIGTVYLLPTIIAKRDKHKNFEAICALNILAGWTFVGWIIALVWALKKDS